MTSLWLSCERDWWNDIVGENKVIDIQKYNSSILHTKLR
jgi:hypothetical protein